MAGWPVQPSSCPRDSLWSSKNPGPYINRSNRSQAKSSTSLIAFGFESGFMKSKMLEPGGIK
eukprot:4835876-Prorocentrum_lima.AAC.1